jgi:hypothetical protein
MARRVGGCGCGCASSRADVSFHEETCRVLDSEMRLTCNKSRGERGRRTKDAASWSFDQEKSWQQKL